MSKMKRLAATNDELMRIESPFSEDELNERNDLYDKLSPKQFRTRFSKGIFQPVKIELNGKIYTIQVNHCANPFCKHYGLEQMNYKGKAKRYKLSGNDAEKVIICGNDNRNQDGIPSLNCTTRTKSNWSVATEIERLNRINTIVPIKPDYVFHKETCSLETTPFLNPKDFYKRGTSTSNSQRYQCKTCKKFTNVLPDKKRNTGYHQQRNDVLVKFADHLINHVAVSRTCHLLKIGRGTYYSKLEWLYRCCLEFLETRETKAFEKKPFDEIWVNTDKMMYVLNNVRKKGESIKSKPSSAEKQLPTQVVISSEHHSRYVFRADVCFDWEIAKQQILGDTLFYKDDHLNDFLSKNARFNQYGLHPIKPTQNDTQTMEEYFRQLEEYNMRFVYVDGLHVNQTYTTMAHLWLIKQMIKSPKWRFITDDDNSLTTSINRIFTEEIKKKYAYLFICRVNKSLSRADAFKEYIQSIRDLREWGKSKGIEEKDVQLLAYYFLEEQLKAHKFHKENSTLYGDTYNCYAKNPIEHPLGMKDRGKRIIDCLTDMTHLPTGIFAQFIDKVNDNSVNAFLQEIRRCISVLERPLVTSRGDGKSYIYSNFNPKYAQMSITILRTFYNFCQPVKIGDSEKTPAQHLGIANKAYKWEDIIYKR
ncbi:insertion element protein [Bacillus sp. AGMB 02131]|uniref:Insertion element protein n=1 Tax=Peribacillus faecalis TaxID=2772559 RepID=A0A927H9G0_9BACI|nr:insertion element protein [Peribacillus faecalis]MBD3107555.1 insertion element protein [Peribacillus faecalis]